MASLQKDLGPGQSITPYTTAQPRVPTVGAGDALASAVRGLGGLALDVGEQEFVRTQREAFKGKADEEIPGIVPEENDGGFTVTEEFDPTQTLNLNQIKVAREQGLLSATQARVQVSKRIREQAAKYPGMEGRLRSYASEFFGGFGPAEGYLDVEKESADKKQIWDAFIAPGIKAGIINPGDAWNDVEGQQVWRQMSLDRTMRQEQVAINESRLKLGEMAGQEGGNEWIDAYVAPGIADTLAGLSAEYAAGQPLPESKQLLASLNTKEQIQKQQLNEYLSQSKFPVNTATRDQLNERITDQYAGLRKAIEEGTLEKMLAEKNQTFREFATQYGVQAMPKMFMMEQLFPGTTSTMIKMAPTFKRLGTEAARNEFIRLQPEPIQQFFKFMGNNPEQMIDPFMQYTNNNVSTGIPLLDQLYGEMRRKAAVDAPIENPEQVDKDFKDNAIMGTLKFDEDATRTLEMSNQPSVVSSVRRDPKKMEQLRNRFTGAYANNVATMQDNPYIITKGRDGQYQIGGFKPGRSFTNQADLDTASDVVDSLNTMQTTVKTYGVDLVGEYDPLLWEEKVANDFDPITDQGGTVRMGAVTDDDGDELVEGMTYEGVDADGNTVRFTIRNGEPVVAN